METIIANHGLPKEIISNKNKLFTSKFWTSLIAQLGIKYKISTTYHPQTNGQTKRMNQIIEIYLKSYINQKQDNWVQLLPLVQVAYNSLVNKTMGIMPFYTNYSREAPLYRSPLSDKTRAKKANTTTKKIKELYSQLHTQIKYINNRSIKQYNKKYSIGPELKKKDKVYLKQKNIKTI